MEIQIVNKEGLEIIPKSFEKSITEIRMIDSCWRIRSLTDKKEYLICKDISPNSYIEAFNQFKFSKK